MSRSDEVTALLEQAAREPGRGSTPSPDPDPPHDPVRVASIVLGVRDLAGVASFYREAVGLHTVFEGTDTVSLGTPAGAGGTVLLTLQHRPDARPDDAAEAGLYHAAFLLPSRADLGSWLLHASRHRVRLDGAADHEVSEAVYLHDPEGNGIEIYADRPRSNWRWQDGRVSMGNRNPDFGGLVAAASGAWMGVPPGTRLGHVHLRVGDVAAASAFYTGGLGLDVVRNRDGAVFMSSGGYHHHIACNVWSSQGAGPRDPGRAGLLAVLMDADGAAPRVLHDPWGTRIEITPSGATA